MVEEEIIHYEDTPEGRGEKTEGGTLYLAAYYRTLLPPAGNYPEKNIDTREKALLEARALTALIKQHDQNESPDKNPEIRNRWRIELFRLKNRWGLSDAEAYQ